MNTLSGGGIEWIKEEGLKKEYYYPIYPDTNEFENANLQIVYLGWF